MRNEEKAEQLMWCVLKEHTWDDKRQIKECALLMAEWKEKQMIDFLKEFISYHDIVTESDVEDFRKVMEE